MAYLFSMLLLLYTQAAIIPAIQLDQRAYKEADTAHFSITFYDTLLYELVKCSFLEGKTMKWEIIEHGNQKNFGLVNLTQQCSLSSVLIDVPMFGLNEGDYEFVAFLESNNIKNSRVFNIAPPDDQIIEFQVILDKKEYQYGDQGYATIKIGNQANISNVIYQIHLDDDQKEGQLIFHDNVTGIIEFSIPQHKMHTHDLTFYSLKEGMMVKLLIVNIEIEDKDISIDFSAESGLVCPSQENTIYYYSHDQYYRPINAEGLIFQECAGVTTNIGEFKTSHEGRGKKHIYVQPNCKVYFEPRYRFERYYLNIYDNAYYCIHLNKTIYTKAETMLVNIYSSVNEQTQRLTIRNKGVKLIHKEVNIVNGTNYFDFDLSQIKFHSGVLSVTLSDLNDENYYAERLFFIMDDTPLQHHIIDKKPYYFPGDRITLSFESEQDIDTNLNVIATHEDASPASSLIYPLLIENEVYPNEFDDLSMRLNDLYLQGINDETEQCFDMSLNMQQWRKFSNMLCRVSNPGTEYSKICTGIIKSQRLPKLYMNFIKHKLFTPKHLHSDMHKLLPRKQKKNITQYNDTINGVYSNLYGKFNSNTLYMGNTACKGICNISFTIGDKLGKYNIFATTTTGQMKIGYTTDTITVKQHISIEADVPYRLIKNDQWYASISVINGMEHPITSTIYLNFDGDIRKIGGPIQCNAKDNKSISTYIGFNYTKRATLTLYIEDQNNNTIFTKSTPFEVVESDSIMPMQRIWNIETVNCSKIELNESKAIFPSYLSMIKEYAAYYQQSKGKSWMHDTTFLYNYAWLNKHSQDIQYKKECWETQREIQSHVFDYIDKLSNQTAEHYWKLADYFIKLQLTHQITKEYSLLPYIRSISSQLVQFIPILLNIQEQPYANATVAYILWAASMYDSGILIDYADYAYQTAKDSNDAYVIAITCLYLSASNFTMQYEELIQKLNHMQCQDGSICSEHITDSFASADNRTMKLEATCFAILAWINSFDDNKMQIKSAFEYIIKEGAIMNTVYTHFLASLIIDRLESRNLIKEPIMYSIITNDTLNPEAIYHYNSAFYSGIDGCNTSDIITMKEEPLLLQEEANISISVDFSNKKLSLNEVGITLVKIYNPSSRYHSLVTAHISFPMGVAPLVDENSKLTYHKSTNSITVTQEGLKSSELVMIKIKTKAILSGTYNWPKSVVTIENTGESYVTEDSVLMIK